MTYTTLEVPSPTNPQILEYTTAVRKGYNSVFVTPTQSGWRVTQPNAKKLIGSYLTLSIAIAAAKVSASHNKSKYYVFDEAGELVSTN